jgi:hypothetical protein
MACSALAKFLDDTHDLMSDDRWVARWDLPRKQASIRATNTTALHSNEQIIATETARDHLLNPEVLWTM